jgi:hypothetical protein
MDEWQVAISPAAPEISNPNFYTFVWGAILSHFMRHRSSRALETRSLRIRIEFLGASEARVLDRIESA